MRIWDIPCSSLCRPHLLGEHNELHQIWKIVTGQAPDSGWRNHPETLRWMGKARALFARHEEQVEEARRRGWPMGRGHKTPLDEDLAVGKVEQDAYVHTPEQQVEILREKGCTCTPYVPQSVKPRSAAG